MAKTMSQKMTERKIKNAIRAGEKQFGKDLKNIKKDVQKTANKVVGNVKGMFNKK